MIGIELGSEPKNIYAQKSNFEPTYYSNNGLVSNNIKWLQNLKFVARSFVSSIPKIGEKKIWFCLYFFQFFGMQEIELLEMKFKL